MFWGLIMEPQKKYSQTVKKAFHISMAALDNASATDDIVQVMCGFENRKYLLCTLQKDNVYQCALDLSFDVGTEVSFITNGKSHVHLSGYLIQDEMDDLMMGEEEEDEEADISLGNVSSSNIVSGKRSKTGKAEGQPAAKKLKTADLLQDIQDDDDEDDSDVDLSDLLADDDDDDDDDDEEEEDVAMEDDEVDDEEEDDDDEDDEDGGEEEDDEDDEEEQEDDDDESEDEADEVFDVPPQNGTSKKSKAEANKLKKHADAKAKAVEKSPSKADKNKSLSVKSPKKTVEGGVQVEDLRVGSGAPAKSGKMLQLYYEGRFKTNNKMFDSTTKGAGFKFRLGRGEVIKGWDVGLVGMKVGGKRRIVCPANMAYGAKGSPPTIPPNSTLVFEVELKNVS